MPKQDQNKTKPTVRTKGENSKLPKKSVSTSEGSKLLTFRIILVAMPFLIFLLFEGLLRIGGYGPNLDIFITHENNPKYWVTNPSVGRRYFFVKDVTPATSYDAILKSKPENGYRIFVLGGSTTAGFPYYHNGAFPRMLQTRLESVFPERTIEIMNLGMPAVNSYTLLDLTDELMAFEPDAFLIYAGHNEFYGALGIASTEVFGKYRGFVNFYLKLQHSKIFYLVKDFVGWTKSLTASNKSGTRNRTLMERMVGNKTIAYGNAEYINARNIFNENLKEIVKLAADNEIPIILANLISNVKTHEPFESVGADEALKQDWDNYYRAGLNHVKEKDYQEALISFAKAQEIYDGSAILHYVIAKTYEVMGNPKFAKEHYYRAKDLDALRFRATEDFNTVIETVAEQNDKAYFLNMQSYFESASPDSLIGNNLVLEHLHPNLQGYALMAKAFFEAMQDHGFIEPVWDSTKVQSDEAYWRQYSVSPMDVQVADARIDLLMAGWPFKEANPHTKITLLKPQNKVAEFAAEVLADKKNWEVAHVELAEYYSSQKDLENAVIEYKTLIRGTPYNISPYLRLGIIYLEMKYFDDALDVFRQSLKIEDTAIADKWIGSIMVNKGEALNGIPYLEKSIKLNAADPEAMFNLTVAFAMLSEFDNARHYCERLIKQYPNHPGAQKLWQRLSAQ